MRRAVMFATLTLLLLAVAGVTVATENTSWLPAGDPPESTAPQSTAPEPTVTEPTVPEVTVPETTAPEEVEKPDEGTVEATVVAPEKPKEPGAGGTGVGNRVGVQKGNGIGEAGKPAVGPRPPEHAQGSKKNGIPQQTSKPEHPAKPPVRGKPEDVGKAGHERARGNPGKVIICHKGRVTISVGAPAQPAHPRHGDSLGAC